MSDEQRFSRKLSLTIVDVINLSNCGTLGSHQSKRIPLELANPFEANKEIIDQSSLLENIVDKSVESFRIIMVEMKNL